MGEPVTSLFTTENLLANTLGQLPFAAVHGAGKLLKAKEPFTPMQRADLLQHAIDESEPKIIARQALEAQRKQPDVSKIPEVKQEEMTPEVEAETQAVLARIRGNQYAIKNDPNLSEPERMAAYQKELDAEAEVLKRKAAVPQSVFGNVITKEQPRQTLIGRQVYVNKTGSFRRILVAEDPLNPPELWNQVIGYSTLHEPNPVFGLATLETQLGGGANTGIGRFSLPDAQWQAKPKPAYEYFERPKTMAKKVTEEQVELERAQFTEGINPIVKPLVNALNGKDVITTGSDERTVKVMNAHVDESKLPPGWRYDPDTGAISKSATVTDQGPLRPEEIQPIVNAVTPQVRPKITVGRAEGQPDLPVSETPMSDEDLQGHLTEIAKVVESAKNAETPLEGQRAVVELNAIEGDHDIPATDDVTLRPIIDQIDKEGLVDPNQAPKVAVAVAAKKTARKLTEKQLKLRELERDKAAGKEDPVSFSDLPSETERREIARVVEEMGVGGEEGNLGLTVRHIERLKDNDDPQFTDILAEQAFAAVAENKPALKAFEKWNVDEEGEPRSTVQKDATTFYDITNNFADKLSKLPYDEVAKFLNDRTGFSTWNEYEVRSFMIRPHVQLWLKGMDAKIGKVTGDNAAKVVAYHVPLAMHQVVSPEVHRELENRLGTVTYPNGVTAPRARVGTTSELLGTRFPTFTFNDTNLFRARDKEGGQRNFDTALGQSKGLFYTQSKGTAEEYAGVKGKRELIEHALNPNAKGFLTSESKDELVVKLGLMTKDQVVSMADKEPMRYHQVADKLLAQYLREKGVDYYSFDDSPMGADPEFVLLNQNAVEGGNKVLAAQGIPAGGGFIFGMKPMEQIQGMTKTGIIPETKFQNVGSFAGAFSEKELGMLKDLVPEAFDKGQVDVGKLQQGLRERGPVVGVKRVIKEKGYTGHLEAAQLQHELETKGYDVSIHFDEAIAKDPNGKEIVGDWVSPKDFDPENQVRLESLPVTERSLINQWFEHAQGMIGDEPMQEDFAFVAPKRTGDMTNYRVLTLEEPRRPISYEEFLKRAPRGDSPEARAEYEKNVASGGMAKQDRSLRSDPHFGPGVFAFARMYDETLPNGEKATHVIEVQGHPELQKTGDEETVRRTNLLKEKEAELIKNPDDNYLKGEIEGIKDLIERAANKKPHPFKETYEAMALKAAIKHAQESGATKIILSDGKTLAMTEGHDKVVARALELQKEPQYSKELAESKARSLNVGGAKYHIEDVKPPSGEVREWKIVFDKLPFIAGDEFHYDKSMPATLERLTNSKPEVVDLGRHKNALSGGTQEGFIDEADARARADQLQQQFPTRVVDVRKNEANRWVVTLFDRTGSPVLLDAEGNPKTNITGRMYDLAKVPGEFTLMGKSRMHQPTTPQPRWANEPAYAPQTPSEIHYSAQFGLDANGRGDGHGIINYLKNHDDPFYRGLALDLEKLGPDSLSRVITQLKESEGAYLRQHPNGTSEITLPRNMFSGSSGFHANVLAHELIHGLTANEMDNPTKQHIVEELDLLRDRLIQKLPESMRKRLDHLMNMGWYEKYANNEISADMNEALPPGWGRMSDEAQGVLYGLMSTKEMVAQGISNNDFQAYMMTTQAPKGKTVFARMTNFIKELLNIGGKVEDTEFEQFIARTDQLIEAGNYVSSFKNFTDRYFERLGQDGDLVDINTDRAMGLVHESIFGLKPEDMLLQLKMGAMTSNPDIYRAAGAWNDLVNAGGEDFANARSILGELGYQGAAGIHSLVDNMLLGKVPKHGDVLDTLPPAAANYIFAHARDAKEILSALQAATREANKGLLNLADPKMISGPVAETIKLLDNVLKYESEHQKAQQVVDAWEGIPPSGYLMNVVQNPEILPAWVPGADKTKSSEGWLHYTFEPIAQWARRVPEIAEVVTKGWQLASNSRKMASEALKAFGMDLTTMNLSKASVRVVENILKIPKLTKAVDQWLYTNQITGKDADAIGMLDANHPEIKKILDPLSPQERDQVEEMVQKHQISQQQMQAQILEKMLQIASARGAEISGMPVKDGTKATAFLLEALRADRNDPVAARAADAQIDMVQKGMQPAQFVNLLKYAEAATKEWSAMQEFYQKNPAWSSGQRYGKFLVTFMRGKKVFLAGVDSKKEADDIAKGAKIVKFEKNQKSDDDITPHLGPDSVGMITKLREFQQQQYDALLNSGKYTQQDIVNMKQTSGIERFATEEAYRGGVPGLKPQPRGLTRGAEELPWLRNHFSWIKKTSTSWSRQLLRAQVRAHLLDPEIAQNPELQAKLKTHFENMMQPDAPVGRFFQRAVMSWFMGFNPASAMVNATQPFLVHTAEFTAMTGKPVDSYRRVIGSMKDMVNYYRTGKKSWGDADTDWFMHEAAVDGERSLAMFDDQAADQEAVATKYKRIMDGQRTMTFGQHLASKAGSVSSASMMMFRGVERFNNDSALLSSFKYYKEQGYSKELAKEKAYEFNRAVNFGGGTAQRSVGLWSGRGAAPRTAAMLATSMQSYVLGTTFQLARYIQQGYFRPEGLTPGEVYGARKAAVQMLGVQLASAGVLGLPFVSGAVAALNALFPDLEVRRHLQEWMDELLGNDKENGSILSDAAMTGVPSMFGWDLQSRLSMGNTVPGVSEVNGFDPSLLMGAPANMV
jgi:hypothetical protein